MRITCLPLLVCAVLMVGASAGNSPAQTTEVSPSPAEYGASRFSAIVNPSEAQFSITIPTRPKWSWGLPATKTNGQEYRMDVRIRNEGREYTFGFYLWKRAGALQQSGDLYELIEAGQASVFERSARRRSIVRDAGIKLKVERNLLTIRIRGDENIKRIFSSRPSEATFKLVIPDEAPVSETIAITYEN